MSEDILKDSWQPKGPISKKIRERIQKAGKRFHSNDNISEFIEEGEMDLLQQEVQEKLQGVLDSLVIDTENDHNTQETAKRVAKRYVKETFGGRFKSAPRVTSFPNMGYKSMYTSGPISIRSTCAHHFQNIVGRAWVGIIPEKEVIKLLEKSLGEKLSNNFEDFYDQIKILFNEKKFLDAKDLLESWGYVCKGIDAIFNQDYLMVKE